MGGFSSKNQNLRIKSLKRRSINLSKEKQENDPDSKKPGENLTDEMKLNKIEEKIETIKKKMGETKKNKKTVSELKQNLDSVKTEMLELDLKDNILNEAKKTLLEKEFLRTSQQLLKIKKQLSVDESTKTGKSLKVLNKIKNNEENSTVSERNSLENVTQKESTISNVMKNIEKLKQKEKQINQLIDTLRALQQDYRSVTEVSQKQIIMTKMSTTIAQHQNLEEEDPENSLTKIEDKIENLKPKLQTFIGSKTSNEYFELDESLQELTLKLDSFKFDKDSELHNKKIQLLRGINNLCKNLDEEAEQTEKIETIEQEIREMAGVEQVDCSKLEELKSGLNLIEPKKPQLIAKKQACEQSIDKVQNLLVLQNKMN